MVFPPFLQECVWAMVKFSPQPSQCEGRLRRGKAALDRMLSWNSISPSVLLLMVDGTADKKEPVLHPRSIARRSRGLESVSKSSQCCSTAASFAHSSREKLTQKTLMVTHRKTFCLALNCLDQV